MKKQNKINNKILKKEIINSQRDGIRHRFLKTKTAVKKREATENAASHNLKKILCFKQYEEVLWEHPEWEIKLCLKS